LRIAYLHSHPAVLPAFLNADSMSCPLQLSPFVSRRDPMPASFYAGDYARVSRKLNDGFSGAPVRAHSSAKQNPMTSSLIRAPNVRRQEAALGGFKQQKEKVYV
jgi:hypothetical protein